MSAFFLYTWLLCQPSILHVDFADKDLLMLFWPCMQLVGENTSKGKNHEDQKKQAVLSLTGDSKT